MTQRSPDRRKLAPFVMAWALGVCGLGLAVRAACAGADVGPTLQALADTIRADANGTWRFTFLIANPTARGLYLDSLVAEFEDADAVERHRPRLVRSTQSAVLRSVRSLSAGDSATIGYAGPALGETGRLTFRLSAHGGDGQRHVLTSSNPVGTGVLGRLSPSTVVKLPGHSVEIVRRRARTGALAVAGVLLVPERGRDARTLLTRMNEYARRGFNTVAVSLPGDGLSSGPGDLAGARDLAALSVALDSLQAMTGTDPAHIGAVGQGEGASALALLSTRRAGLKGVALVGGDYDLEASYRSASTTRREWIRSVAGSDRTRWRARSALFARPRAGTEYLVVHAEADSSARVGSARSLAAAFERAGAPVQLRVVSGTPGALEMVAPDAVNEFIDRVLHR